MKTMIISALMLFSLQSIAGSITLLDKPVYLLPSYDSIYSAYMKFDINKDLGRAWVRLTLVPHYSSDDLDSEERILVPGLSYDSSTQEIILAADGANIVCATVKIRRILGVSIKDTGLCSLSTERYTARIDDGFEIRKVEKVKFLLNY